VCFVSALYKQAQATTNYNDEYNRLSAFSREVGGRRRDPRARASLLLAPRAPRQSIKKLASGSGFRV